MTRCLAVITLLAAVAGCGGSNRAAVTGTVTLDNQPIANGAISFIPKDSAAGPAAWGPIEAGHYSIDSSQGPAIGKSRVEIRWTKKTGKQLPAMAPAPQGSMKDETVEAVPDRYNSNSELEADLKSGQNTFDFNLTTKK